MARKDIKISLKGLTEKNVGPPPVTSVRFFFEQGAQIDLSGTTTQGKQMGGFANYNHSGSSFPVSASTWTNLPNNGSGTFSVTQYLPEGVTTLLDPSTGRFDFRQLENGDAVLIRNDFNVTPNVNGAFVSFRYTLGSGFGSYTLEKQLGALPNGSGLTYKQQFTDYIFIGDDNTRLNFCQPQVSISEAATVEILGSVINVIKREF